LYLLAGSSANILGKISVTDIDMAQLTLERGGKSGFCRFSAVDRNRRLSAPAKKKPRPEPGLALGCRLTGCQIMPSCCGSQSERPGQ
jgi:hypothetical protein